MKCKRLYILQEAFLSLKNETHLRMDVETGGVLMGYHTKTQESVITHACPPGPHAIHEKYSFVFDSQYCQNYIHDIYSATQGRITYIGDWHSHIEPSLKPSSIDRSEIERLSKSKVSRLSNPFMVITYGNSNTFDLRVFQYSKRWLTLIKDPKVSEVSINEFFPEV